MADVFISYAREDRDFAEAVAKDLEARGLTVWFDVELAVGEGYARRIQSELTSARAVVVLWSQYSVKSDWVLAEAEWAASRRVLIPLRIENVDLPVRLAALHTPDIFRPFSGVPVECLKAIESLPPRKIIDDDQSVYDGQMNQDNDGPQRTRTGGRFKTWHWWSVAVLTVTLLASLVVWQNYSRRARTNHLLRLDARLKVISAYINNLEKISKARLPGSFYGPLAQKKIEVESRKWLRLLGDLRVRRVQCESERSVEKVDQCVTNSLRQFPTPKQLPPPGQVFLVREKPFPDAPVVDLQKPVPNVLVEETNAYFAPLTLLAKGEWAGQLTANEPGCRDWIFPTLRFESRGEIFKLHLPDGRKKASELTDTALPPPVGNRVVMTGWPAKRPLSVTFEGAAVHPNPVICTLDTPAILMWQHDDRINSSNPYEAAELVR